jgi:predicted house-cleaning noncanonical NTP pyrophosphatase (MazG superfamily)
MSGEFIYKIFFEGTTFEDTGATGEVIECSLKSEYDSIQPAFENALSDIAEMSAEKQITNLDTWYEVIQRIMSLWNSADAVKQLK